MRQLTVTQAVEALLGAVSVQQTERIVESKRRLGTELILEGVKLGGELAGLGRGKGGGGADEGEGGDRLHDDGVMIIGLIYDERSFLRRPLALAFPSNKAGLIEVAICRRSCEEDLSHFLKFATTWSECPRAIYKSTCIFHPIKFCYL